MLIPRNVIPWAICLFTAHTMLLAAGECRLETLDEKPRGVDPGIVEKLASRHLKLRIDGEDFCEIWTAKTWQARADSPAQVPSGSVEYALEPGSLVGVVRLAKPCSDLRDQDIPAGVYTLRYAVQPESEAHRDSHDSRDFLLLVSCSADKSAETIVDQEKLIGMSCDSIASMHPAFFPLSKSRKLEKQPSVRRDERDPDGWIVSISGKDQSGKSMAVDAILPHAKLDE